MVSLQENSHSHSHSHSHSNSNPFSLSRSFYSQSPSSTTKIRRQVGRSMRRIRSNLYQIDDSCSFTSSVPETNLTESDIDIRLGELAAKTKAKSVKFESDHEDYFEISQAFTNFSACSSDISGELERLAGLPTPDRIAQPEPERQNFSTEIIETISLQDLQPIVQICIDGLKSDSIAVKRSAAAKLRLLAKNRSDNRELIGGSGAIPALIPLLQSSDPWTQEHAVTALLNLSLFEPNKISITNSGGIKPLVYVLKTGTETSKQNAAYALLSLALLESNKSSIGVSGAIPPLVSLLMCGSTRGKKDALTTLYKLCSLKQNKERAVMAGAVRPLVKMVAEQGSGLEEKAMVILNSLAGIEEGKEAIVEEGGIAALVEVIEDGSVKGKEFAVVTLLQMCGECVRNRGLLVREGGIPPLVALSQCGSVKAKHKAETLLGYLRELRQEAASSSRA